jgi:hypothetical protein
LKPVKKLLVWLPTVQVPQQVLDLCPWFQVVLRVVPLLHPVQYK